MPRHLVISAQERPLEFSQESPERSGGRKIKPSALREQPEQGKAQAQFNLAEMCCRGGEVLRDYAEALIGFERAAGSSLRVRR